MLNIAVLSRCEIDVCTCGACVQMDRSPAASVAR